MENWQKHIIFFGLLVLAALLMPVLLTGLGLLLSPVIHPLWLILIFFTAAVVIGYKNREK